jgi:hypothetical protein
MLYAMFLVRPSAFSITDDFFLAYDEATNHMFRRWHGKNVLLYTDDLGGMTENGHIVIKG